jgi:DNA polymerase III subunit beta
VHFEVKRSILLENINIVQRGIPLKTTITTIQGVLLQAKNNCLTMVSNNLEMSIKAVCEDIRIIEEGWVVLPGEIVDILKQAPHEDIEIKMAAGDFRTEIISGKANFFLYGMNPEEFPSFKDEAHWREWGSIEFSANEFKNILKKVNFAVSHDEGKPSFRGVLFQVDENKDVFFISSDTYRLAHLNILKSKKEIKPLRLLIPGKTLLEIMKILDDSDGKIQCYFQENEIIFSYRQFLFAGRLIENKFPDLTNVFPKGYLTKVSVNTRLMEKAIGRASLLAHGYNQMISIHIKDNLLLVKSGSEVGRMEEELVLESKEGDDLEEILLNARFILDPLRVLEHEFTEIEFNGSYGPCIINSEEQTDEDISKYRYLVLPIKIDKKSI